MRLSNYILVQPNVIGRCGKFLRWYCLHDAADLIALNFSWLCTNVTKATLFIPFDSCSAAVVCGLRYSAADPHVEELNPGCGGCILDRGENAVGSCAKILAHVKQP